MAVSKYQNDSMLDAALAYVATADRISVVSTSATTMSDYTQLFVTYALITPHTMTTGAGNGDYTLANGAVNGRMLTVAAQPTLTVTASATAGGVALGINGSSTVVYVTTCTSQSLTSGNTVSIPAWTITLADAT
jgi:hypothetical protein